MQQGDGNAVTLRELMTLNPPVIERWILKSYCTVAFTCDVFVCGSRYKSISCSSFYFYARVCFNNKNIKNGAFYETIYRNGFSGNFFGCERRAGAKR